MNKYFLPRKYNILITGLGSIGQRRARLLKEMYGDLVQIYAYRLRKREFLINDDLTISKNRTPEDEFSIISSDNLEDIFKNKIDVVFITNPPHMHIQTAEISVKNNAHIFIEKPLSHNMDGISELVSCLDDKNIKSMVGHQLRYHYITTKVKELLDSKYLGNLISIDFTYAEYLPSMHSYEDYRTSHASHDKYGGGAILSLNHDIDIMCYLFGIPNRVYASGGKLSKLELNTEDTADILYNLNYLDRDIVARIHLDLVRRPTKREWSFVCDNGTIVADLTNNTVNIFDYSSGEEIVTTINDNEFHRNKMFINEINDFMQSVVNNSSSSLPISEALKIMHVVIASKESLKLGKSIDLSVI